MERNCRISCFGDSITRGYYPYLREIMGTHYGAVVKDNGINGQTASDGLRRVGEILALQPNVVVLGFGLNDCLKGIPVPAYRSSCEKIIERLQQQKVRVLLNSINPVYRSDGCKVDKIIDPYNQTLDELAHKYGLMLNNISAAWDRKLGSHREGLIYEGCDFKHPNQKGYQLIADRLSQVTNRSVSRLVWQFNGANAACNYRCPYCYEKSDYHTGHHFQYDIDRWNAAFKETFGIRRLNFYLSFGEALIADSIKQVVRMVESEPRWKLIILTNLSAEINWLLKTRLAKEGRLFLAASFHPQMTKLNPFIDKLLHARRHGIEIPVVYVMWPPQIKSFEDEFYPVFQRHNVLVHVRRFWGEYRGRWYPRAYSWEEIKCMARYMDDLTIKYMVCDRITSGKESYAGMSYFLVRNDGALWVCPQWKGPERHLGNIIERTVKLGTEPMVLGGKFSDGTTDGIANLLETKMEELDDNHILSFCHQTGFRFGSDSITYPNINTCFDNREVQNKLGLKGLT